MSLRVHHIKTFADNSHEILFKGTSADFDYIAGRLKMEKDVQVFERKSKGDDIFTAMLAKGSAANPLTRARVIELLNADPEIELTDTATN